MRILINICISSNFSEKYLGMEIAEVSRDMLNTQKVRENQTAGTVMAEKKTRELAALEIIACLGACSATLSVFTIAHWSKSDQNR